MKVKTVKNFYDRKEGVDRKAEDKEPFEVTPERYKQIQQYVEIVEEKKESKKESKEEWAERLFFIISGWKVTGFVI